MPRKGFVTASQTKPLLVDGRTAPPFGRGAVTLARQIARVMAGIEKEDFDSKDIDRGNRLEDPAIACFERTFKFELRRPNFLIHPEIEHFGGTPDGISINDKFGVDIKCPNQKNHHDNLSEGIQLSNYKHQFQSYMAITGIDRWALVSYNPDFDSNNQLAVAWMKRDQEYIDKLLDRVKKFYPLIEKEYQKLSQYKPKLNEL